MIKEMVYGDLHIHSYYSNGYFHNFPPWVASTPEEILKKAKERNLKVVAITDHDSLGGFREAVKIAGKFGLIVIPACEVTSKDGHILAYGIKKEIPKKLGAEKTIELIHQQGGIAVAPHPFTLLNLEKKSLGRKVFDLDLDGWETASATCFKKENLIFQKEFKMRKNLTQTGGSDSHSLDFIGLGVTVFKKEIKTIDDVLSALKNKQTETKIIKYVQIYKKYLASFRDQFKFILRNLA